MEMTMNTMPLSGSTTSRIVELPVWRRFCISKIPKKWPNIEIFCIPVHLNSVNLSFMRMIRAGYAHKRMKICFLEGLGEFP